MTEDGAFYDRALTRLSRMSILLALTSVIAMSAIQGWRGGLGAASGALFSLGSLHRWKRVAGALGGASSKARLRAVVLASYALLSASVFVIIRYFGVSALSVVAGLFVSMAAVVVEIVYELLTNAK